MLSLANLVIFIICFPLALVHTRPHVHKVFTQLSAKLPLLVKALHCDVDISFR